MKSNAGRPEGREVVKIKMAILSLVMAVVWMLVGFGAKPALAGGCVCGGNGGNYCYTNPDSLELVCDTGDSSFGNLCCDFCGGGPGCGSKPDDSGCAANEYKGSCYKCTIHCRDGECWEVCKVHDWTCCPCGSLDIDPDNLTATPLSETAVRLDWTPKGTFNGNGVQQYVQWTNNPNYYGQCNIYSSQNPCSHSNELDPSTNTYTLTDLTPNTRYYIEVDGYQGLTGACPAASYMEYLFYPPLCWLTPESAEIMAGESTNLTMNIFGGGW